MPVFVYKCINIITLHALQLSVSQMSLIFQTSLRQMNQTRFYLEENAKPNILVELLISGLPLLLSGEEYTNILKDSLEIKGK